MNSIVLREFKLFFRDEEEALLRASDYMNSDARKSADRRNVMIAGAIGGVAGATGYLLEYVLNLPRESHVGRTVTISGVIAAVLLFPSRQARAAKRYLRENFASRTVESGERES
jgi:hypothetical protein